MTYIYIYICMPIINLYANYQLIQFIEDINDILKYTLDILIYWCNWYIDISWYHTSLYIYIHIMYCRLMMSILDVSKLTSYHSSKRLQEIERNRFVDRCMDGWDLFFLQYRIRIFEPNTFGWIPAVDEVPHLKLATRCR